jgi:hypothetical protein
LFWRSKGSEVSAKTALGTGQGMIPSSLLLIVIGIVLAILVNYILGVIVILIGLALLIAPMVGSGTRRV